MQGHVLKGTPLNDEQISNLTVGDHLYFQTDYDEIPGQLYEAEVTDLYENFIRLLLYPVFGPESFVWDKDEVSGFYTCVSRCGNASSGDHLFMEADY